MKELKIGGSGNMPDDWKDLVRHIDYKDSPSSMKFTVDITLEDINKYLKKYHPMPNLPEVITKELWEQYLKESKPDENLMIMLQEQVVEDMIPWARKNRPKEVPEKKPKKDIWKPPEDAKGWNYKSTYPKVRDVLSEKRNEYRNLQGGK